jgi:hypothetical protein
MGRQSGSACDTSTLPTTTMIRWQSQSCCLGARGRGCACRFHRKVRICIELLSKSPSASPDATGTSAAAGTRISAAPATGTDAGTKTVASEAETEKKTAADVIKTATVVVTMGRRDSPARGSGKNGGGRFACWWLEQRGDAQPCH